MWRCYAWQIGGFVAGKGLEFAINGSIATGRREIARDVGSLALGGIACTMFPLSALAQSAFLGISETFFLYSIGASATDVGITAFMHSLGIAGNSGLSRYASQVWSRFDPNNRVGRFVVEFLLDETGAKEIDDIVEALGKAAKPILTQWGWSGSNSWRDAVNQVAKDGVEGVADQADGIIRAIGGKVPTYAEAVQLIEQAGGTVVRAEGSHAGSAVAGHIDFSHIICRLS